MSMKFSSLEIADQISFIPCKVDDGGFVLLHLPDCAPK